MLAKYVLRGHAVYLFIASDGALGGDAEARRQEQKDAARILGVREVFWGDYRDTEVPLTREIIVRLESVIREIEPRMIFVNSPDDTHQHHRDLAQSVMSAARPPVAPTPRAGASEPRAPVSGHPRSQPTSRPPLQ